jgi:aminocarboxymuconate-semialdehyde decarboxylase
MSSLKKINGHGHLLPYPEEIPRFMRDKKLFWVDQDRKFMRQGSWSRPVTDASFFLNEKLEWMEKNKLDHSVLLTLSQLYCNNLNEYDTKDVLQFQNDYHAEIQYQHEDKFTCGFVVQPRFTEQALLEIERNVTKNNLKLLCLPTHFVGNDDKWTSVADESVFPIYELANHYNLAIEIHPYDGNEMVNLADKYWRFHLVWMCAQTADTHHLYTLLGIYKKFQNIRTCFAHANMLGQANFGRRMQGFMGRPDLFEDTESPAHANGHPNIFFDTLVHDPETFRLLINRAGANQVLAGLDDPYPLGEMETVPDCYPGKVIDEALKMKIINQDDYNNIWHRNVLNWLGKTEL